MQGAMAGCTSVSFTARCEDYRRRLCRSPATQGPFTTWLGWGLIRLADVGACVQEEAQHALRGSAIGAPGSTATPRVGQGMYVQVFDDRIVFTLKNIGDYEGLSTEDILESYTVWLYK